MHDDDHRKGGATAGGDPSLAELLLDDIRKRYRRNPRRNGGIAVGGVLLLAVGVVAFLVFGLGGEGGRSTDTAAAGPTPAAARTLRPSTPGQPDRQRPPGTREAAATGQPGGAERRAGRRRTSPARPHGPGTGDPADGARRPCAAPADRRRRGGPGAARLLGRRPADHRCGGRDVRFAEHAAEGRHGAVRRRVRREDLRAEARHDPAGRGRRQARLRPRWGMSRAPRCRCVHRVS